MKSIIKCNIVFAALSLLTCLVTSCGPNPKDVAVERLTALFTDAKANSKTYSDEQWVAFLEEYQQVDSMLRQQEFTTDELAEISPMKGRCAAYALKAQSVKASLQIGNALNDSRGVFKGFLNTNN